MKICMVNPPLVRSSLYKDWDLHSVDTVSPPLGVLLLSGIVREKGHNVSIIDAYANNLSIGRTVEEILSHRPEVVGITATTPSINGAAEVAKALKKNSSAIKVIIGGAHLTAVPEETMRTFPQFDIGVIGEGDETIAELLSMLSSKNCELEKVGGIIFRIDKEIRTTPSRPPFMALDSLPLPAWDLLPSFSDPYRMSVVGTASDKSSAIVTSRGCPGVCSFCDTRVFGKKFRAHSANYVLKMIRHLIKNYAIKDFLLYDDSFVTDKKRLAEICSALINERYGISWSCCARVNMVDPEMLKLMKDAGCWQIEYGIESGSPEILKIMNKRITLEQIRQALRWTKEAGIMTRGNFIFGYPGETKQTLEETLRFMLSTDLDYFQQTFLTPYPGSEVYEEIGKYGKADLDWTNMNNLSVNFIPEGLSQEYLIDFSKKAFKKFYLRPHIIWVHLRRLNSLDSIRRFAMALFAFFRTIFR